MYLRSFNLSDFGCFQLSQMRSIEDGLVVIGGPQRAGKTTFMQAVRQLGPWGVKRGNVLPPAADEYRLSAEFEYDGTIYSLTLNGHGTPVLASQDGDLDLELRDIFRDITRTQYEQVYTISLDELKRLPDGIESQEDILEVLLGAAYGDVAVIPRLEEEFDDRADEIGRTFGKATDRSLLRGPMDTIEAGIERRDDALGQIETYHETHGQYTELLEEIEELETTIEGFRRQRQRLSVIESEFDDLRRYQSLGREIAESDLERAESLPDGALRDAEGLAEDLEAAHAAVDDASNAFVDEVDPASIEERQEALLSHEDDIETFQRERSGWSEQVKQVRETAEELETRRNELEASVAELHESWTGTFEPVKAVKTDRIHQDQLKQAVETFTDAQSKLDNAAAELEEKEAALAASEARLEELQDEHRASSSGRRAVAAMGLSGVLAVAAAVTGREAGSAVAGLAVAVAVLAIGLYYATRTLGGGGGSTSPLQEERAMQNQLRNDIAGVEAKLDKQETRQEGAADAIREAQETLGVPESVSPVGTREFYNEIVALQEEIRELEADEVALEDERDDVEATLQEAASTVEPLVEMSWDEYDLIGDSESVFDAVDEAYERLQLAIKLRAAQTERNELHEKVDNLLAEWPGFEPPDSGAEAERKVEARLDAFIEQGARAEELLRQVEDHAELEASLEDRFETEAVQSAFEEVRNGDDEDWMAVLEREAEEFVDRDEVEDRYEAVQEDLEGGRNELEELNKQQTSLEAELAALKSDEDIVEARRKISEGRAELRRLGEEYAVNRLAEHLTERLHERFLEEMAGPLIDEASEIFSEITQEYDGIAHTEQLDNLDFEALRGDKPAHETAELSRATTEQLFLAVRLARIRQLETSLPVVIDDSMTNFDPAHGARAVQAINELATTNQVFFLTCHPEQVALLDDYSEVSQYWCLEHGSFDGPHEESDSVYELLHVSGSA